MISWKRQGPAVVGHIELSSGEAARVVLVESRDNPNGAVLVRAVEHSKELLRTPFYEVVSLVPAPLVIEVACMQERIFGEANLPAPDIV